MSGPRRNRWWQAAAVLVVGGLTVALTQSTTSASFTGQTSDTGNSVATANDFCAAGGTTLGVTNDTALYEQDPATPHGSSTTLEVQSGAGTHIYVLLRFTLPTLANSCRITSAKLRLYATSSQGPGSIEASRASTTWASSTATWNMPGRPAPAGTPVSLPVGTTGWHEWTVTTLVQELYAGPDYGFLLRDQPPGLRKTVYESRDAGTANGPQLVLTWG